MNTITMVTVALLDQGRELLQRLDDHLYRARPAVHISPVGSHLRHCFDFYDRFFAGLPGRRIDYDDRTRDEGIEQDRQAGLDRLSEIRASLIALPDDIRQVEVEVSHDRRPLSPDDDDAWSPSTVGREMQFLLNHTVHHYALISLVLRLQGFEPDVTFGVAPSTLDYQEE